MRNINLLLILILIVTVIISCDRNNYQNEISKRLNAQFGDSLKNYEMIVILPGSGCTGCITNAEIFFVNNINNSKIKFILTHSDSKKNLGLKLGKENIYLSNVFIDDNDLFYLNLFEEKIYPMAVALSDGKIVEVAKLDLVIQ